MEEEKEEEKKDGRSVNIKSLKKELDEFKKEVRGSTNKILDILEGKTEIIPQVEISGAPTSLLNSIQTNSSLPQQYQVIFEEYFDVNDGFTAQMDFNSNITFTITVPIKFSNITEAYRDFYHEDKRTVVLNQGDIEGGIRKWCDKVAKNLK